MANRMETKRKLVLRISKVRKEGWVQDWKRREGDV